MKWVMKLINLFREECIFCKGHNVSHRKADLFDHYKCNNPKCLQQWKT